VNIQLLENFYFKANKSTQFSLENFDSSITFHGKNKSFSIVLNLAKIFGIKTQTLRVKPFASMQVSSMQRSLE